MARDPQNPQQVDEELARAERDAEPQPLEIDETLDPGLSVEDELSVEDQAVGGSDELDQLTARIEELEAELAGARDQALRAAAEAQNARRRADQEVDKARKFALEKFVGSLLPVVDSLDKALESLQDESVAEVHREGVRMTRDLQLDALRKAGVSVLDPQGEPFDPQYHEAMAMVPNPAVEPNTVIEVLQKGYLLNDRLVRPAMVVVSKVP
ncbi:nucleotide exchange factor GrpE [Halotalea alkalilenta]|uniref:Protein GrpE n=1 Tax=Halotalea alkalilenta TaxID=376489 RepID=A0A172YA29_9GAMM|nr:nucleotide exchange factor GrpE [Halotalea alkalilenta]ANF56088.1 nucleotide exchange factor GrpE [Halotalea alkalilenta]